MGTYIIAGFVSTPKIEKVIGDIRQRVLTLAPQASIPKMPIHVTIVPPFEADYEFATGVNLGSLMIEERLRRKNRAFALTYSVRGEGWFSLGGKDVLHLPIDFFKEFREVAARYRELLGEKSKYPFPDEGIWHPHFTIAEGPGLRVLVKDEMLKGNWIPRPIRGVVSQIVLLAKYRRGYDYLGMDPDQECR